MKLKKLTEKRNQKALELKALYEVIEQENRAFTEDETTQFNDLEQEIANIDASIQRQEKIDEILSKSTVKVADDTTEKAEERAFKAFLTNNLEELRSTGGIKQSDNGGVVPTTIANRVIKKVVDKVDFLKLANVINTNGKLSVPKYTENSTDYINAGYATEGTAVTDNAGEFTTIDLTGYLFTALSLVSTKLIDNTDVDIVGIVIEQMAEAIALALEKEFIVGTSGKIEGILETTQVVTTFSKTVGIIILKSIINAFKPISKSCLCLLKSSSFNISKNNSFKVCAFSRQGLILNIALTFN